MAKQGKPKFKVPRMLLELEFPKGSEYEGAVITTKRSVDIGVVLELQSLSNAVMRDNDVTAYEKLLTLFADSVLIEWNLTDEDKEGNEIDVPASFAGLRTLPLDIVTTILQEWTGNVAGVKPDSPLAEASPNGVPSPALSVVTDQ